MLLGTLISILAFFGMVLGLSRPWAGRLGLNPAESVVAGCALSLVVIWLGGWAWYVGGAPLGALFALPAAAGVLLILDRRAIARLFRDPEAGDLAMGQALVTAWGVCWLTFIISFSGGCWISDWYEHWERTLALLHHWPHDHRFLGYYPMSARPPLVNVVTMVMAAVTRADFAHQQVFMAAFSSLAYMPAALLAGRFASAAGGSARTAFRVTAALFIANPLFIENVTFPWTKLPAAFFVLAGLYFFLRSIDRGGFATTSPALCGGCLAGAIVAHYSAGPYAVTLGVAWLVIGCLQKGRPGYRAATAKLVAAGCCVLAPWFLWSLAVFGPSVTFLSNSSMTSVVEKWPGSNLERIALNLLDTLVPYFMRTVDPWIILQTSPWGSLSDLCFQCYQLNLPLAMGCLGWIVIAREAIRASAAARPRQRIFWIGCLVCFVVGGVAVVNLRDHWGLTHVCLQPFVLLALAFLAARWELLGPAFRAAVIIGASVDLCLGIALHFAVQDLAPDAWFNPGGNLEEVSGRYSMAMRWNLRYKLGYHLDFFNDVFAAPHSLVVALLASLLLFAVFRCRKRSAG